MKSIRQAVTCLCLVTMLSASAPCLAQSGSASPAVEPGGAPVVQRAPRLDLSRLKGMAEMAKWSDPAIASPEAPIPLRVQMQTSGGGWSGLSTAKKTWIIVGSVVGGALIVGAVSHHGSGGGGGGY
jgi:hypothetical protein